jgi:RND family efflux transporter MFP subunit
MRPFSLFPSSARVFITLFAMVAPLAILAAVDSPLATDTRSPSPGLNLNTIARGSFRSVLRPAIDVPLSSRAAGIVDKLHVPEGSTVKVGQPIITLDADQERAEVAQAEASLRGARAEMERAKAEFDRIGRLHTDNISSDKQFLDAKAQSALAESRHDQAVAALELAKVRLANRSVVSPIDGIFLKTNKLVGEAVERYETVARIVDITKLEMVVFCDAKFFSRFRTGQKVEIRVFKTAEEQPIITGVIFHTDPIIDPSSGTFRVKIQIDPSENAAAGLSAILIAPAS